MFVFALAGHLHDQITSVFRHPERITLIMSQGMSVHVYMCIYTYTCLVTVILAFWGVIELCICVYVNKYISIVVESYMPCGLDFPHTLHGTPTLYPVCNAQCCEAGLDDKDP